MGSNMIIAIVVGAILVIVGFSLWPVLNASTQTLYAYFRDSCDDGNNNRFLRAYYALDGIFSMPAQPSPYIYYVALEQHGGAGMQMQEDGDACLAEGLLPVANDFVTIRNLVLSDLSAAVVATDLQESTFGIHNEHGEQIGTKTVLIADNDPNAGTTEFAYFNPDATINTGARDWDTDGDYRWVVASPMLLRFAEINNLLLSILPVVSIAGFLGISGAKLYSYGKGVESMGAAITTSLFTLIGIVVAMVIAGPVLGSAVDAHQVVDSGQYQVNNTFGNVIQLLFAMIPVVYVAGLVTLVGLQARTAFFNTKGGSGMDSLT